MIISFLKKVIKKMMNEFKIKYKKQQNYENLSSKNASKIRNLKILLFNYMNNFVRTKNKVCYLKDNILYK